MERTITIHLSDEVYEGLRRRVDADQMSQFIEDALRPLVVTDDYALLDAYREMASDTARENEALEWSEAFPNDGLK